MTMRGNIARQYGKNRWRTKYSLCKFDHLRRNLLPIWLQPDESSNRYVGIPLPKLLDLGSGTQFGSVGLIECAMYHHHDFC